MSTADGAAVIVAYDDVPVIAVRGDADVVEQAICDGTADEIAHNTGEVCMAEDVGVAQNDVLHRAAIDVAEEADALVVVSAVASTAFIHADAADGKAIAVVSAAEELAVAADAGEVVIVTDRYANCIVPRASAGIGVGDVGGLPEGDAQARVSVVDDLGEVVEVLLRGNLVAAVAELVEVCELGLAYAEILAHGASVVADAGDDDGATHGTQGVTDSVVGALGERDGCAVAELLVGDGGHGPVHAVVEVGVLDAADGGSVVLVERRVGGYGEGHHAERGLVGKVDSYLLAFKACDGAARNGLAVACGHAGAHDVLRR